jgi:hypothetical protein
MVCSSAILACQVSLLFTHNYIMHMYLQLYGLCQPWQPCSGTSATPRLREDNSSFHCTTRNCLLFVVKVVGGAAARPSRRLLLLLLLLHKVVRPYS